MSKLQIDGTTLAVSILAVALGLTLLPGPFAWLASIAGLVLAIVLLGYDREGYRSVMESLGFSAAVALCLTLASAVLLKMVAGNPGQPATIEGRISSEWMPLIWAGLTILIAVIDRTRMSGRVQYPAVPPVPPVPALPPSFSFAAPAPVAAAAVAARPVATEAQSPQPSAPQTPLRPTFTQPSFGETVAETSTDPVLPSPAAIPRPVPPAPVPAFAPSVPDTPAPLPPTPALPVAAGKPTMIYVSLVGEGLNVLRAVGAEHLGRDYYKIVEEMPEGETWEFGPGQVVRCKKKNLSSGKAMVATEEAPRAR